ncbi:MAG: polyprenol monophosphomannose synthase [Candidatus Saganbacteria bacterium]|nr:polyprenol monophosphomannose synthase [Candidatus Saganbacteria bacterium]
MISIIVPTYNERENIFELVERVFRTLDGASLKGELIVVDDNSPDGTAALASSLKGKFNIEVLRRKGKMGLASAVLEGFKAAKGDILCVMDADLSHPPEVIPEMFGLIESGKGEIAIGSRLVKGGGSTYWPASRKIVSLVARVIAMPLTDVRDSTSGYFMLKRSVVDRAKLNPIGFKILLEILARGDYNKVLEVPITFVDREGGRSKMGAVEILEYLGQLGILYFDLLRGKFRKKG